MDQLNNNNNEVLDQEDVANKKTTDFSIESILRNRDFEMKSPMAHHHNHHHLHRPMNKIFSNPWTSTGPIVYNPEYHHHHHHPKFTTAAAAAAANLYFHQFPATIPLTAATVATVAVTNAYLSQSANCDFRDSFKHLSAFYSENIISGDKFGIKTQTVKSSSGSAISDKKLSGSGGVEKELETFCCKICDKVFGCAGTLEIHVKAHRAPRYECDECGKGFSQLRNYKYHLSVHRGTKEFAAECPECGKVFNDKGYLSSHLKIHRNRKEYSCPHCPKSFNQRVAFNMHVRIHTGVKPHKCSECGKRFSRKMLLKQHLRTHSGEKPYQCAVCGKTFADRSNMTLHHKLHSGIKPFACPICPKAFTKKHHLKTHINYHTGCKPYICPHLNCGQAFTQSSNMRTHAKKCQMKPPE